MRAVGMKKKRTKKQQQQPSIERVTSDLPCEVVYNILSRLPVKSLLRFRSVSKPWRDVISEPEFVKKHHLQSTISNRQKLLVLGFSDPKKRSDYSFYSVDYQNSDSSSSIDKICFPLKKYRHSWILGSCNGLVLLEGGEMLVLWNPATRIYKRFSCIDCPESLSTDLSGLCYDSANDDYKAVFGGGWNRDEWVVFSFRSHTWKVISDKRYSYVSGAEQKVTVNDALHWAMKVGFNQTYNRNAACVVVYFDLVEENFKEVPLSDDLKDVLLLDNSIDGVVFYLSVMQECLCLFHHTRDRNLDNDGFVLWMMKESWTKLINVEHLVMPRGTYSIYPSPLSFTKNGRIIVARRAGDLIIYNPMKKTYRNYMKLPSAWGVSEAKFVETLVSPNVGKMTTRKHSKQQTEGEM